MKSIQHARSFTVELHLKKAGPVRPRTKYKQRKLLTASHTLRLPFVPFIGLILTFTTSRKHGGHDYVYLRVRCVEWLMPCGRFSCVVDDISNSMDSHVMWEVRDEPHAEQQFNEVEKLLRSLGFNTTTKEEGMLWTLYKTSSGYEFDDPPYGGRQRGQHSGLP